MKKILNVLIIAFLSMPLFGYTLKGGVTYTVETARKEAFAGAEYRLPRVIIKANKVDPNFRENKKAIKQGVSELSDRYIQHFSSGGYGIIYKKNKFMEYYYFENGKLEFIGRRTALSCPRKVYRYNTKGELTQISFYIEKGQSFIFSVNGKLEAHWIKNNCYDDNGNVVMQRY